MTKIILFCLVCFLIPISVFAEQDRLDVVIRRAPVPDKPPYQGEVKLIRRDGALVIQTVLNSKVLRHVIAAIQKKELKDWPENSEGWIDSRRYTDELFSAYEVVQTRAKKGQDPGNRHLQLLIEFVLEERRSYVALYAPTLQQDGDQYSVVEKELLKDLKTSRQYLYNNMLAIAQDSFKVETTEILELMQPIPEEH